MAQDNSSSSSVAQKCQKVRHTCVGGIFWFIWTTFPTDPNFLNFIGPMLFILESCAVGFTIIPLGKEWSWSVSLWEILRCYKTSSSIKLGNYWEEFYKLAWKSSLSGLSLAESSIQKGKEVLQQWVYFICLKTVQFIKS